MLTHELLTLVSCHRISRQKGDKHMDSWIVQTKGLKKYYEYGGNLVKALDGVDFTVREHEFLSIIGKSGSGK